MLLEDYIKDLREKNEKYKIKKIVKEYNKEMEFKLKGKLFAKSSYIYFFTVQGLIASYVPIYFTRENISLIVRAIYIIPLLILTVGLFVSFLKLKRVKKFDVKLFFNVGNFFMLQFIALCFSMTYILQLILFDSWGTIEYLKVLGLFLVIWLPVIISSIRSAPKRFIKTFLKENNYKTNDEFVKWTTITLIGLVNLTKPYRLLLVAFYAGILYLTPLFIFALYKNSKCDYIQSLMKS